MITLLTSSSVDGAKDESRDGVIGAWSVGGIAFGGSFEHRKDILSSRIFRNEAARVEAHEKESKYGGVLRKRRKFKVDQNFRR